jgi:hypothetical protein
MKRKLLAAGGMLLLGVPLLASPPAMALDFLAAEAGAGWTYFSYDIAGYREDDVEAFGSFVVGMPNGFKIEVDSHGGVGRGSQAGNSDTFWILGTTVNAFYSNDDFAIGAYGGVDTCEDCNPANYFAGIEAIRYIANLDLGAGVGWLSNWEGPDAMEAWGQLTAYPDPDTSLGIGINWNGDGDRDEYGVALFGQHRFTGTNWGLWGNVWLGREVGDWETTEKQARIGFIYYIDPAGTTLRDHNRLMPWD